MALSIAIALVVTWAAIALSYQTNWPVGFYVGVISAMSYAAGRTWTYARRRRTARPPVRVHATRSRQHRAERLSA